MLLDQQSAVRQLRLRGLQLLVGVGLHGVQGLGARHQGLHFGFHLADVESGHGEFFFNFFGVAHGHLKCIMIKIITIIAYKIKQIFANICEFVASGIQFSCIAAHIYERQTDSIASDVMLQQNEASHLGLFYVLR